MCVCVSMYMYECVNMSVHAQAVRNTRQTCLKGNEEVPETFCEKNASELSLGRDRDILKEATSKTRELSFVSENFNQEILYQ